MKRRKKMRPIEEIKLNIISYIIDRIPTQELGKLGFLFKLSNALQKYQMKIYINYMSK